jgi:hypothetical protein
MWNKKLFNYSSNGFKPTPELEELINKTDSEETLYVSIVTLRVVSYTDPNTTIPVFINDELSIKEIVDEFTKEYIKQAHEILNKVGLCYEVISDS